LIPEADDAPPAACATAQRTRSPLHTADVLEQQQHFQQHLKILKKKLHFNIRLLKN
jgi:hypothetical protein